MRDVVLLSLLGLVAACDRPESGAWIEREPGGCPSHLGWVTRPLFDVSADESSLLASLDPALDPRIAEEAPGAPLPDPLAAYCLLFPDRRVPVRGTLGPKVVPEQRVVAPAAASDALGLFYAARTATEICQDDGLVGGSGVRLTLLDTAPTGDPSDRIPDGHGEAMAAIADAACVDCAEVEIVHRIALPIRSEDAQIRFYPGEGGRFGSVDWLAQAVYRAVLDAPADQPHVLNLSLAFHADFADRSSRADVAALYDAIRYARCSGALVIAAAGNLSGPDKDDSPQYPAAWSQDHDWICDDFGLPTPKLLDGNPYDPSSFTPPLLYAAGALGDGDEPIGLSRPGHAWTPLMAWSLAVTPDPDRAAVTGTSVASAVVAATAARAWSTLGPDTEADEVMIAVWSGAKALPHEAEFGSVGGERGARRVASCLGNQAPSWPSLPDCADCAELEPPSDALVPYGPEIRELATYRPEVSSAPDTGQCPVCSFVVSGGTGTVTVTLPNFAPGAVTGLRLATQAAGSSSWSQYPLVPFVAEPASFRVPVSITPSRAILTFQASGAGYAAEIPVLLR